MLNTRQKLALAKTANAGVKLMRRAVGLPMRDRFTRRGIRWELDLNEGIDFAIYLLGAFEPEVLHTYRDRLPAGGVAVDIGANIGAHTLPLAQTVRANGRVLAFEPTDYAFCKLSANLALNPELAAVVNARQSLLAESASTKVPETICSGWPLDDKPGLHPEHRGEPHTTSGATSMTLDCALEGVERVDFVKLDVDGHELSVLRGGAASLKRFHPPILIELCPHVCPEHGHPFSDLVECLTGLGYGFESLAGKRLPSEAAALERLIPRGGGLNVLAVMN